jgi:hypothetical protein
LSAVSRRSSKGTKQVLLTRESLARLRLKARQRGVWFRDLKQSERKLLSLTIRVVQRVRSSILAKLVSRIVDKLCEAMDSKIFRLMKTKGRVLAEKLSRIGQVWGNKSATSWATDQGFIQYLTVNNLSSFGGFIESEKRRTEHEQQ